MTFPTISNPTWGNWVRLMDTGIGRHTSDLTECTVAMGKGDFAVDSRSLLISLLVTQIQK